MLLFIGRHHAAPDSANTIQIHLMLLFIRRYRSSRSRSTGFKYISCYCLSEPYTSQACAIKIQIHLMLLFIQLYPTFFLPVWCIQIHLMLLFILEKLSQVLDVSIFKYISCYCLSAASAVSGTINGDSNTSHVIVYPGSSFRPMPEVYSNTSHVIVYPGLKSRLFQ